jgi:phage FluMu protein Com
MIAINGKGYRECRCKNDECRKLFFYEYVFAGRIAITCPRCGTLNEYNFKYLKNETMQKEVDTEHTVNLQSTNKKGGE